MEVNVKDIDKSIKLYEMMMNRCVKNGFSKKQATVYQEIIDLMKTCATAKEASKKIKNSKYFILPSACVLQDKLMALSLASKENDMGEVADIYEKKVNEIESDIQSIYETGYGKIALDKKNDYLNTYYAFLEIYIAYLTLSCAMATDKDQINNTIKNIDESLKKLIMPSSNFDILVKDKNFRRLINANDIGYKSFGDEITSLSNKSKELEAEVGIMEKEFSDVWDVVLAGKEKIMETGISYIEGTKASGVIVISPKEKTGSYTFEEVS